jgi:hypothetical protein
MCRDRQFYLGVWVEVEGQTILFRRRGVGGGTRQFHLGVGVGWRDRQERLGVGVKMEGKVRLGLGVEVEGQTALFRHRGGGRGTSALRRRDGGGVRDKSI